MVFVISYRISNLQNFIKALKTNAEKYDAKFKEKINIPYFKNHLIIIRTILTFKTG